MTKYAVIVPDGAADVRADPGARRPAACAAGAGLIHAVVAESGRRIH